MKWQRKAAPREGREQSQRQLKMGESIRHTLSQASLREDLTDPLGQTITLTFTEVRCSADLRLAKAYYVPFGNASKEDCEFALAAALPVLQSKVAKSSTTKFTPKLIFVFDTSFDQAEHLRQVLSKLHN